LAEQSKETVKKSMQELERKSVSEMKDAPRRPIIVILDEIRTADAFAIEAIYLCGHTPIPPHRDIHKTALGATETVSWMYFPKTTEAIITAKDLGYTVYSVEQAHNSMPLNKLNITKGDKIALIFGNEVTGVNDEALQTSAGCIEIPQWGAKHSLNISVSIGVVLWELVRS
jgi:23S rRNA (guanosine2251-2'-O)-methyltransferase